MKPMDLTCILCPRGCRLHVDEQLNVTGNFCPRGKTYATQEASDPRRTLTSVVKVVGGSASICPVKTKEPIPKGLIGVAMKQIKTIEVEAPVKFNQVIDENIAGTGIHLITTLNIEAK